MGESTPTTLDITAEAIDNLHRRHEFLTLSREVSELETVQELERRWNEATLREAWGDPLDTNEYLYDSPGWGTAAGDGTYLPISQIDDRAGGRNAPLFRTEQELAEIRGTVRLIVDSYPIGHTVRESLISSILGEGFTYKAVGGDDGEVTDAAAAVQADLKRIFRRNNWYQFEEEYFWRLRRDGEVFIWIRWDDDAGLPYLRFVEPECVTEPKDPATVERWLAELGRPLPDESSWTFGIHTDARDSERIYGYYVQHSSDLQDWEYITSDQICHLKLNVDAKVKRGLSDFFSVRSYLANMAKLDRNVALGAAVLSAIVGIVQHPTGTSQSAVSSFLSGSAYRKRTLSTPNGTRTEYQQKAVPGSWLHVPKGQDYKQSPLANQGVGQAYVEIKQAQARTTGGNWLMPEYMISGDASNANYASTLVASSPWVKYCRRKQRDHGAGATTVLWKCLAMLCRRGRFALLGFSTVEELQAAVDIESKGPIVEHLDRAQETNRRKILHDEGILSAETWAAEEGYDLKAEAGKGARRVSLTLPAGGTIPGTTGNQPPERTPAGDEGTPQNVETANGLNGAQITAAKDLMTDLAAGRTAPEVAVELLISLGLEEERAKRMVAAAMRLKGVLPEGRTALHRFAADLLFEGYP